MSCPECYSSDSRVTPILDPESCLMSHEQYICSTCRRYICAEADSQNKYRIKYPFKSLDIAKLYLRAAETIYQGPCEIYEIEYSNGRTLYKIFKCKEDMLEYLRKIRCRAVLRRSPCTGPDHTSRMTNPRLECSKQKRS